MASAVSVSAEVKEGEIRSATLASKQMRDLFWFATRISASDAKVLITGESGVGKEVLARHIHAQSARRGRECVTVNCAGVADSLLESELFGHVKGSFTGAYRDKLGTLQLAHMGTLFLDEIGEMSARMQALLLRFLESGEIQPVGADTAPTTVNVRLIAATNRDLAEMVAAGQFREDLLYRLRVMHLDVPPLRERCEDVRALGSHFLQRCGRNVVLTDAAWDALARYRWPGNVRELRNVIEQLTLRSNENAQFDVHDLPEMFRSEVQAIAPQYERRRQLAEALYHAIVEDGYSFWGHIHAMFMNRDITRLELRELVSRGLSVSMGNYRGLLALFSIPASDYKRFMNFLTTHDCRPDFRDHRNPRSALDHVSRVLRRPLLPEQRREDTPPALESVAGKHAAEGDAR
jgi:transcriptional regulator with PAS, ATPase and Fis domain